MASSADYAAILGEGEFHSSVPHHVKYVDFEYSGKKGIIFNEVNHSIVVVSVTNTGAVCAQFPHSAPFRGTETSLKLCGNIMLSWFIIHWGDAARFKEKKVYVVVPEFAGNDVVASQKAHIDESLTLRGFNIVKATYQPTSGPVVAPEGQVFVDGRCSPPKVYVEGVLVEG